MDDEPISLAEVRAVKAQDSRLWSPRDALASVLRAIDSGEIAPTAISIDYYEDTPDGDLSHHYTVSNLTREQRIAMLVLAQQRALEEWRK